MSDEALKAIGRGDLVRLDLDDVEDWREYDFAGRVYRINAPVAVYFRDGGTTHRVVDSSGVAHIVPAPGHLGCVIRFHGRIDF